MLLCLFVSNVIDHKGYGILYFVHEYSRYTYWPTVTVFLQENATRSRLLLRRGNTKKKRPVGNNDEWQAVSCVIYHFKNEWFC